MRLRTQTFGPLIVCIFLVFPGAELSLSYQLRTDGLRTSRLSGGCGSSFLFTVGGKTKRKQRPEYSKSGWLFPATPTPLGSVTRMSFSPHSSTRALSSC